MGERKRLLWVGWPRFFLLFLSFGKTPTHTKIKITFSTFSLLGERKWLLWLGGPLFFPSLFWLLVDPHFPTPKLKNPFSKKKVLGERKRLLWLGGRRSWYERVTSGLASHLRYCRFCQGDLRFCTFPNFGNFNTMLFEEGFEVKVIILAPNKLLDV